MSNSKIRIFIAEVEGSDAAVLEAIRACSPVIQNGHGRPTETSEVLSEANREPLALDPGQPVSLLGNPVSRPKVAKAPRASKATATSGVSPALQPVLDLLRKGPLSSGDVIKKFPSESTGTIYQRLAMLRDAKVIESRVDDGDGQRKNFVIDGN